jgi:hypothetical protein
MKHYRAGVAGVGFIGATHIEALRRLGNVVVCMEKYRAGVAGVGFIGAVHNVNIF